MLKLAKRPFTDTPREPEVVAKTLVYGDHEEHLVRRLGNALVLQWDCIPDALQDLLIDQAAVVEDRAEAPHAAGDIEVFLRKAKTTAVRRATPQGDAANSSATAESEPVI